HVTLETVELADLRLGRAPEMICVGGVVRLRPNRVGVSALVLVMHEVAHAHHLVTALYDGRRRFECRGGRSGGLEYTPQLRPLPVNIADGNDFDHPMVTLTRPLPVLAAPAGACRARGPVLPWRRDEWPPAWPPPCPGP